MYARKGLVDTDDVKNMPIHLKRWAIIPNVTGDVLLLVMVVQMFLAGKILADGELKYAPPASPCGYESRGVP